MSERDFRKMTKVIIDELSENILRAERKGADDKAVDLVRRIRDDIETEAVIADMLTTLEASGNLEYRGNNLEMLDSMDMLTGLEASIDGAIEDLTRTGVEIHEMCGERIDYAVSLYAGLMRARLYLMKYKEISYLVRMALIAHGLKMTVGDDVSGEAHVQ